MTGRDARVRDFSVPPGQMREELVEQQGAIAEEMFCPQFLDLWKAPKTHSPSRSSTSLRG